MLYTSIRFLVTLAVAGLFAGFGCGGDEPASRTEGENPGDSGAVASDSGTYEGWETYTYDRIKVYYPPTHPRADSMFDAAQVWLTLLERNAMFFGIDVPQDTVVIFYYTGFGQGREMTGREYPFVTDTAIHFWQPSFYGPVMARWVIRKWSDAEPRYPFLKHGLIALLDFSGQNYHRVTVQYVDSGTFIPLRELAVDTAVNSDKERVQSAEAASFVDFLVFSTSPQEFRVMYESPMRFDALVSRMFKISVDSLEAAWLRVAEQAAKM